MINFQSYPNYSAFVFWILTTLLLLIVLLSSPLTYQTYSYPLMLSLAIVILLSVGIKLSSLKFLKVLVLIAGIHLVMIPEMIENVNKSNQKHLLKDSSISPTDINNLQLAIDEIRTNNNYEMFQNINNFQEIDFSVNGIIHLRSITGSHTKLTKMEIVSSKIIILEIVLNKITTTPFMEV